MSKNHQKTLIWTIPAIDDVIRLREFIEPHNKKAAIRAANTLKKAATVLLDYPLLGKLIENRQEREFVISFGKHGYVMRYRVIGDTVVVLRIWHGLEDKSGSRTD